MEGDESIHIKISPKFRTFGFLPIMIAGMDSKCILEIENTGKIKLPKMDFRWKIESEMINVGKRGISTGEYDNIYGVELEPGKKKEESFHIKTFISGHHKLTVGVPDSEKGGAAIVGELEEKEVDGKEVAGKPEQKGIRFHAHPEMHFVGPWCTFFEVYSWYLLAIGIGTLSAFGLLIFELAKFLWKILGPGFKSFLFELFRLVTAVI